MNVRQINNIKCERFEVERVSGGRVVRSRPESLWKGLTEMMAQAEIVTALKAENCAFTCHDLCEWRAGFGFPGINFSAPCFCSLAGGW